MKVDVGYCTSCGEKNSKFVEKCYKCSAVLPWGPGYVAPAKAEEAQTPATPVAPAAPVSPALPATPSKTVVVPSASGAADAAPSDVEKPDVTPEAATSSPDFDVSPPKRALPESAKKWLPLAGWGLAGILAISCIALMMRGPARAPQTTTPIATATPDGSNAAANTATNSATNVAANAASPGASPTPAAAQTPVATPVPPPQPPAAPTASAPVALPLPSPKRGPSFSDVTAHADEKTTNQTQAQRDEYWKGVFGTKIVWSGELMDAQSGNGGRLSLKCNPASPAADVSVALDGKDVSLLAKINKGQRVTIEGILQSRSGSNFEIAQGRIAKIG